MRPRPSAAYPVAVERLLGPEAARRAGWFLAVAAVLLACLWVAGSGSVFVVGEPYPTTRPSPGTPSLNFPPETPATEPAPEATNGVARWVVVAIIWAMLAGLVVGIVGALLALWRARRLPRPSAPERIDVAESVLDDLPDQLAALADGRPADGILACWLSLEESVAEAGVDSMEWQTPAEYTRDVLRELAVDEAALDRLAALYREARFSEHLLDEEDRAQARAALLAIHRDLAQAR